MEPFLGYIGPGAGFAALGSFLILAIALVLVVVSVLTWPFRAVLSLVFRKRRSSTSVRRVILVGLDGLDPRHARRLMTEGRLPHLKALSEQGSFGEIQSTCPPISPVAWSSFMTGANPGKHNIFDFLNRDLRTYLPELSSSRVVTTRGRFGRRTIVKLLRKSKPFWKVLGEHGVFSTVLRVPITFPPEKFHGLCLSAMCVPDLQGTQGTFICYATDMERSAVEAGGTRITVAIERDRVRTHIPGPDLKRKRGGPLQARLIITMHPDGKRVTLRVNRRKIDLEEGQYSPWVRVTFRHGLLKRISGICRFYLVNAGPAFRLYVTPLNLDPEHPAMPISHPPYYSVYLSKLLGPFATLGIAEDTWALNEGVIDEDAFLEQVYAIHEEREDMFFEALKRTRRGLCACVFDAPDRIQHMYFRHLEPDHPANRGRDTKKHAGTFDRMYARMDALVGRVMERTGKNDVLIVLSDHGFTSFQRGVNLNAWLREEGYLAVKPGAPDAKYLTDIDWEKTRAYTFGLSGIYINRQGREEKGIVPDADAEKLKAELIKALETLRDPDRGEPAIHKVHDAGRTYHGPYANNGPDLIVGYRDAYRASWDAAVGKTGGPVFSDNTKCWSGDHCVDRDLVPGVLFINRKMADRPAPPGLIDIAPTVLDLFGVAVPSYMDGKAIRFE